MFRLKILCIMLSALSLISAIAGFHHVSGTTAGTFFVGHDAFFRAYSVAKALVFAALFYSIQKRLPIGWNLGWLFFAAILADFLVAGFSFAQKLAESAHLLALIFVIACGSIGSLLWAYWWKGKKVFFKTDSSVSEAHPNFRPLILWGVILLVMGGLLASRHDFTIVENGQKRVIGRLDHPLLFWGADLCFFVSGLGICIYGFYRIRKK